MKVATEILRVEARSRAFVELSAKAQALVDSSGIKNGLLTAFVRHTSASLVIQENADPSVREDLENWLSDLAPESRNWTHADEGPDDMPAHAKGVVTGCSQSIPIIDGALALGTWQGLYLWEHRDQARTRQVAVTIMGTA